MVDDENSLWLRIKAMLPQLNERQRRLFLAAEAKAIGYGGVSKVSRISGVSRVTITKGIDELEENHGSDIELRCRRSGGGRKSAEFKQPGIMDVLKSLVEAHTNEDPTTLLIWTTKSICNLSAALGGKGYTASHVLVSAMLKKMGYTLQADRKDITINMQHSDRNTQFQYVNEQAKMFFLKGTPVLLIDAKKKEKVGNFANTAGEYSKGGEEPIILDHDFAIPEPGSSPSYSLNDLFKSHGFVNIGISPDTAESAVETLRKWWAIVGTTLYPDTKELLVIADSGGSKGSRGRLWKAELQILADELGIEITVLHFPPGISKWKKIEHRLFAFIRRNWRERPLISLAFIVSVIGSVNAGGGAKVNCLIDGYKYQRGVEVSDEEYDAINIKEHKFHGDWNYTVIPHYKEI